MEKREKNMETNKACLSDEQKQLLQEALGALENDKPIKDKVKEAKEKKKGKTNDLP